MPIAGDFGCAFAGGGFLLKTGFDERFARFSPGLVLRGAVLRAAIAEGLRSYDFLGGPDPYKARWASGARPRVAVSGYRGAWRAAGRVPGLRAAPAAGGRPPPAAGLGPARAAPRRPRPGRLAGAPLTPFDRR